jgi:hypothetical protein
VLDVPVAQVKGTKMAIRPLNWDCASNRVHPLVPPCAGHLSEKSRLSVSVSTVKKSVATM